MLIRSVRECKRRAPPSKEAAGAVAVSQADLVDPVGLPAASDLPGHQASAAVANRLAPTASFLGSPEKSATRLWNDCDRESWTVVYLARSSKNWRTALRQRRIADPRASVQAHQEFSQVAAAHRAPHLLLALVAHRSARDHFRVAAVRPDRSRAAEARRDRDHRPVSDRRVPQADR